MSKMALVKYLVRNRANGVDHYEFWEEDSRDVADLHADRPTKGDGLFPICEVEMVVDEEHYTELERVMEAASITGVEVTA